MYDEAWRIRPFTNVPAIREAILWSEKDLQDVCRMSAKQWQKKLKKGLVTKFDNNDDILNALLPDTQGTCTNFTIHVINQSSPLNFVLGDVGGHRIAWTEDGVLIDSTARDLIQLEDGQEKEHNGLRFEWRTNGDEPNSIRFGKNDDPLKLVESGLTWREGIKRAFIQTIDNAAMIVYFRVREEDVNQFNGMLKWKKGSSDLIWTEDKGSERTTWTTSFGQGTVETESTARKTLTSWGQRKDRAQQWEHVAPFILLQLWPALDETFGKPICRETNNPV